MLIPPTINDPSHVASAYHLLDRQRQLCHQPQLTRLGKPNPLRTSSQHAHLFPPFHLDPRFIGSLEILLNVRLDDRFDLRGLEVVRWVRGETDFDCEVGEVGWEGIVSRWVGRRGRSKVD